MGETVGKEIEMSAAITHEDVRRVYERFDNARIVQKGVQIEFVTMHFDEKELKKYLEAQNRNLKEALATT